MQTLQTRQIELVRASWALVTPAADAVAADFYRRLLALDPSLAPLFKGDMAQQGRRLIDMIGAAIGLLDRPATLAPVLRSLGLRHGGYGVRTAHYRVVGEALMATLRAGLGEAFTCELSDAWGAVYSALAQQMRVGAGPAPAETAERPPAASRAVMPVALALAVLAIVAAAVVPAPALAQEPATAIGWHPATARAKARPLPGIDPNTFLVQPPVQVTWLPSAEPAGSDTRLAAAPRPAPAIR